MFALDFLTDVGDGNIILQAKFKRSKKFMFMALRRKLSASWLMELEDNIYSPAELRGRLEWQRMPWLLTERREHLAVPSEALDPPSRKPLNSTCNAAPSHAIQAQTSVKHHIDFVTSTFY